MAVRGAFSAIQSKRQRPWRGEEEVRLAWVSALEAATGLHFDAERARKDSSYNHVIIEFKAPGFFKGSKSSAKFKEATELRLLPYIQRESKKTGIPEDDFIGIAIDGEHVCFAQVLAGSIQTQHLVPFSEYAVELVVQALLADTRRAITVDNLLADFGHGAANARGAMQALADALAAELSGRVNTKTKMLFEEWRTLYGQVADMSVLQAEAINQEIGFEWNGTPADAMSGRLFVIHTYNSMLIKLLAAEIVSAHGLTSSFQPAQAWASMLDDRGLMDALAQDVERGDLFAQAGIRGFVEEVIFGWYIDVGRHADYSKPFVPALRRIIGTLSLYRTDRLSHARDVLRDLYQGLVPGKLRQSLGEFYTPDWLVELTVDKVSEGGWLPQRVLDPTCGSGAFLLDVLRRKKAEARAAGWSPAQTVKHLCTSVWGFDLNPLAVQTARVNFLMEIADLLRQAMGTTIEVPVLLADAIYSPAPNPEKGEDIVEYKIGSQVARLEILLPAALAMDRLRLDHVFQLMAESVEDDKEYAAAEASLIAAGLVLSTEATTWREPLKHTYDQVLALHRMQWNGIWFRVVRNFFWSATAGHFDCIVGNPPWVRWSKLPNSYRDRVKPTCEGYGIFSSNKRHGGNELDISAMITYTTADKWLRVDGRMAFVITGTIFKNPSSEGFRRFKLAPNNPNSLHLVPVSVDDLKALKPFEDAANHTTIAVFHKAARAGTYPVPYTMWTNADGYPRSIPSQLALPEVMRRIAFDVKEAAPVGGAGSPWAVLSAGRYQLLEGLAGKCDWVDGRKGITTDLNGVYFVPIRQVANGLVQIESRPEAGKKDIGAARSGWVEPDLLYPLVKGAGDFESCYLRLDDPARSDQKLYAFVPNTGIGGQDYEAADFRMSGAGLRQTSSWFSRYRNLLLNRSTFRRQMPGAPFFAIYNVGDYTFQPWKVIWPEMSTKFYAAVAGQAQVPGACLRPYVPDHKVYFAGFGEKEPAYFLCGLLNCPLVREWIESHNISIQVGDVFKHMQLPQFNRENVLHIKLASLVEAAHNEHESKARSELVRQIEHCGERILRAWLNIQD
ncbi:N-6 DNA methylase [Pseudomonas sp. JL972]|nr:N-6 DNA methylase [Stutzerimonas degradans]